MTPAEFRNLLEVCGADPLRWPPGARQAAERLVAASPEMAADWRQMQAVEAWLNIKPTLTPPNAVELAMRSTQLTPEPPVLRQARTWGAVAAAVVLTAGAGFAFGWSHGTSDDPAQVVAAALGVQSGGGDAG